MNIFRREIKAHYKGLIGWSLGMIFTIVSGMAKFGTLTNGQSYNQLLQAFPKPVLVIFGIQGFNLDVVIGYFGVLFLYILLLGAIHAAILGSEIISKEERDRTSEFLFPKPVSRARVVTEKLTAGLLNIVILNIITIVTSVLIVQSFAKDYSNNSVIFALMAGLFFMQLIFFSLGAAMAGFFKNPKLSSIGATTVLLSTYIMWVVIDLNSNLENLKYLTPFKYFDASVIIDKGRLDPLYVSLSLLIIVVLITTTYLTFNKRDIKV